jgi:zinc transport system substrate-binding protein
MRLGIILNSPGAGARRRREPRTPAAGLVAVLAALSLVGSACTTPGRASDGRLQVVTSFYPLAEAAERVGGDQVDVTNLTPPGVEAHDFELTPKDVEAIATADLVVYLGGGFQPSVEDALDEAEGKVIDVLHGLPTLSVGGPGSTLDPHVWLDPELYVRIVETVERALADLDPKHAEAYAANAADFESTLADLDDEFSQGLATCDRRLIVTGHEAFGYLAARYGLEQQPITGLSPEAEPDAKRLAELRDLVEREGVTTIFTETLVSPEVAQTLASEAGVKTAVLNPLEGLTEDQLAAGEDYVSVMRRNLATLEVALGCG